MICSQKISVIIPCRNEAGGIRRLVRSVPTLVDEVIVVDNGSTDKTVEKALQAGAKVIQETRKDRHGIGYGYALQAGMKAASGDILITMDGDGTYPTNQIKELVEYMEQRDLDMVLCSRFPLIRGKAISYLRKFGVWLLNQEVRWLFGYPINDVLSGMWVVRSRVLRRLKLKEGGWNLSPEIKLAALLTPGLVVGQYHIDHYVRDCGASKQQVWQTGFEHLIYIFKRWYQDGIESPVWYRMWLNRLNQFAWRFLTISQ